ncbi:MAG: radical SAM protein [Acidobacteria bacterium]|nr:radical SAM protein [Acidobacteriota bacterium]
MAGAIAGTAVFQCFPTDQLHTVTLTVNNACNLSCPHCYLQYKTPDRTFFEPLYEVLERSTFSHLAVVGKEPLLDDSSVRTCERLADATARSHKTLSLISNGANLRKLREPLLERLSYIDISLDGGAEHYSTYRRASIAKLLDGLKWVRSFGFTAVNALHVINSRTIKWLDDMLTVREWMPFHRIVFSPYVQTLNDGVNSVGPIPLREVIDTLNQSSVFNECDNAILLVDHIHLMQGKMSLGEFTSYVAAAGLSRKVFLVDRDPLEYGILRLTFDGLVMAPYESLNPRQYHIAKALRSAAAPMDLEQAFVDIRASLPRTGYAN